MNLIHRFLSFAQLILKFEFEWQFSTIRLSSCIQLANGNTAISFRKIGYKTMSCLKMTYDCKAWRPRLWRLDIFLYILVDTNLYHYWEYSSNAQTQLADIKETIAVIKLILFNYYRKYRKIHIILMYIITKLDSFIKRLSLQHTVRLWFCSYDPFYLIIHVRLNILTVLVRSNQTYRCMWTSIIELDIIDEARRKERI